MFLCSCHRLTIHFFTQVLKWNGGRAAGSVIILVSQGTVSGTDLEASLDLLRREEVSVAAIEYPSLGEFNSPSFFNFTNYIVLGWFYQLHVWWIED